MAVLAMWEVIRLDTLPRLKQRLEKSNMVINSTINGKNKIDEYKETYRKHLESVNADWTYISVGGD